MGMLLCTVKYVSGGSSWLTKTGKQGGSSWPGCPKVQKCKDNNAQFDGGLLFGWEQLPSNQWRLQEVTAPERFP